MKCIQSVLAWLILVKKCDIKYYKIIINPYGHIQG